MNQKDSAPNSLNAFALKKLKVLEAKNQRRVLHSTTRCSEMRLSVDGGPTLVSFTDNDYLGLSTHPEVIRASVEATEKYGAGAGASRLVTGSHPLYDALEAKLAEVKGTEDAVVFGSGYLANVGIISTLMGVGDLIIADELVHNSIHTGMQLSKAKVTSFRHNDTQHVADILEKERNQYRNVMIVVDGVYSMDGDIAPLQKLGQLAKEHNAWLMTDDAHALGTVGGGRGSAHACDAAGLVPLQMGTLSKSLGAYGGYLAASKPVIDLIKTRARSLIYTTGLPPGTVAAALKALEIMTSTPGLTERPTALARRFASILALPEPVTPLVPLIIGEEAATMEAATKLTDAGFKVAGIRPPTVPAGTSRLRFCFSASHRDEDVEELAKACLALGLGSKA